jgi:hypothetical protein
MKKIKKILIFSGIFVITLALGFVIWVVADDSVSFGRVVFNDGENLEEVYEGCAHFDGDEDFSDYVEPTVVPGKYYLNGDKTQRYYQIFEDNTIQLGGDDYEALALADAPLLDDSATEEEVSFRNADYESRLHFYSTRFDYVVITRHYWADTVEVTFNITYTPDGSRIRRSSSLDLVNDHTLQAGVPERPSGFFQYIRVD